jgi:DNA mismatch repair protein MutS
MVEMSEMASILKHASSASLLILDEIGRGTSTFDGMAIARAVLEYCADKRRLGAKTMFATHYHELSALEGQIQGVRNYNITAKKQNGNLVFLRKIVPGAADDSYGIEVAKLAGLPDSVIAKAKGYLKDLEASGIQAVPKSDKAQDDQISLADVGADQVRKMLLSTDLNSLTPIEAMNLLYELQRKARS